MEKGKVVDYGVRHPVGGLSCSYAAMPHVSDVLVKIDPRTMFENILSSLGCKIAPKVSVYECPNDAFRAIIKMDLSGGRFLVEGSCLVIDIEGDICRSQQEAQENAVSKAFSYLTGQHNIKINDYSSHVESVLHDISVSGHLTSALHSLKKLVEKWEYVLERFQSAGIQLEGKHAAERMVQGGEQADVVYYDLQDFISESERINKKSLNRARSKCLKLECEHKKYISRSSARYNASIGKDYTNAVLSAKDVLGCVLEFFGAGKAVYSNGPFRGLIMKGEVSFDFPELSGVDICGSLKIYAKHTNSKEAEEAAAFEAISYLERKCKIRIVDFNYANRNIAESEEKLMVHLIDQISQVGNELNRYWRNLVIRVKSKIEDYPVDTDNVVVSSNLSNKDQAYIYSARCIVELTDEVETGFANCAKLFKELSSVPRKFQKMKYQLRIE